MIMATTTMMMMTSRSWFLIFVTLIAFTGHASSSSVSSHLPKFTTEPSVDGPIKPGTTVTLTCAVELQKNVTTSISWMMNGQQSIWRKKGVEIVGGQLRVLTFNHEVHEGFYQCLAENQYGAVLSSDVKLEAAVLHSLSSNKPPNHVIKLSSPPGSTIFINCPSVVSKPNAIYSVLFNDTLVQVTDRHKLLPSGILQITGLAPSDQGMYKCVAYNPILCLKLHVDNVTYSLQVLPKDFTNQKEANNITMMVANKNLTGNARQNLTLECAASGSFYVDIHWEKYGGHLPASKTLQDSGLLLITNAQKSEEGTYECTATGRGHDGSEVVLRKAVSVNILEPPSVEIISPEVQTVAEGSTVSLKCKSTGSSRISYKWFYNGVQVTSEQFVTVRDSSLTMSNVNRKRSGAYQCFASNHAGSAYSVIRLVVLKGRSEGSYEEDDDDDGAYEVDWVSKAESSRQIPMRGEISVTKPTATLEPDLSIRLSWHVHPKDQSNSGGFQVKVQMKNLEGGMGWETIRDNMPFNIRTYVMQRELLLPGKTYRFRICLSTPTRACINSPESIKVYVSPNNNHNLDPPINARKKPPQPKIVQAQTISCTKIEIRWQLPDHELEELDYEGDAEYYDHERHFDHADDKDEGDYIFQTRKQFPETRGQYSKRGVESFYIHYAPYQELDKTQTLKVEEGDSRTVTISNLRSSTYYSFKMQSVLYDGLESNYSNSVVKETTDCFNLQRQPFDGQSEEAGDHDPYSSQSRNPNRPSGGRNFNEFASQSLYVVGGVLFVVVVAALVIAMIVCLYKRKGKENVSDKTHPMNQTLMHCYQATQHQLNGHNTTIGSAHVPNCNGHCTVVHTLGANSIQGVEYCRPMDLAESRALANQLQPCLNSQSGKKPPPDLDLPPPPPLPPFQNSAYRGDNHGDDALLYDQLSDPDENDLARNSSLLQKTTFQNEGIYHPLSQHNSPASAAVTGPSHQVATPQCPPEENNCNAYWVLENFSRTPSEGSGSAVSGGYYVTNALNGLQSQPLLPLHEHPASSNAHHHALSSCYPGHGVNTGSSSSSSSSSTSSAEIKNNRRDTSRHSPTTNPIFESHVYRLDDSDLSSGRHGNGYSLT